MRAISIGFALAIGSLALVSSANAGAVSQREYKRGYNDCLRGDYDQNQHGASYKRGCRAAEGSGKTTGREVMAKADANFMRSICHGAVIGKFNPNARSVRISNVEHQDFGWGVYGNVILDDGATSDFVCMFSSTGQFKRINASDPIGASYEMEHEDYCPPDVAESNRYQYPGCN